MTIPGVGQLTALARGNQHGSSPLLLGEVLNFMPRSRVLLVEDDVEDDFDVRLVMEHVLIDGSYEVDATDTASGARKLLENQPYDLVLTDGRLVNETGMELADQALE